jgi:hypothetical protein
MTPDNKIVGANSFEILAAGESSTKDIYGLVTTSETTFTTLEDDSVSHAMAGKTFPSGYWFPANVAFTSITVNTGSLIAYIK